MTTGNVSASYTSSPQTDGRWGPQPARSRGWLIVRFVLMILYFPVHVLLCTLAILLSCVVSLLIYALLFWLVDGPDGLFDWMPDRPRWWVGWSELRHEGDAAHQRKHSARLLEKHTRRHDAALARRRNATLLKPRPAKRAYGPHIYRAIGAREFLETAARHGWEPDPGETSRPAHRLHLRRPVPGRPAGDT